MARPLQSQEAKIEFISKVCFCMKARVRVKVIALFFGTLIIDGILFSGTENILSML